MMGPLYKDHSIRKPICLKNIWLFPEAHNIYWTQYIVKSNSVSDEHSQACGVVSQVL
jgi:hypothetical protein